MFRVYFTSQWSRETILNLFWLKISDTFYRAVFNLRFALNHHNKRSVYSSHSVSETKYLLGFHWFSSYHFFSLSPSSSQLKWKTSEYGMTFAPLSKRNTLSLQVMPINSKYLEFFSIYCSLVKAQIPLNTKQFFQQAALFVFLGVQ